jgi:hypothetical protein
MTKPNFIKSLREGIATEVGRYIIVGIIAFVVGIWSLGNRLDRIDNSLKEINQTIHVLDSTKLSKFTFGVYNEMQDGYNRANAKEHQDILNAVKEIQSLHPRQRGQSTQADNTVSFNVRYRAIVVYSMNSIYANNDR